MIDKIFSQKEIFMNCNLRLDQPAFKGRQIPLSEYKGPILKLTKSDKEKISKLQEELVSSDFEMAKLNDLYAKNIKNSSKRFYFECLIQKLEVRIEEIKKLIKEIKLHRIQQQKRKLGC